jgi:hypothetical protein
MQIVHMRNPVTGEDETFIVMGPAPSSSSQITASNQPPPPPQEVMTAAAGIIGGGVGHNPSLASFLAPVTGGASINGNTSKPSSTVMMVPSSGSSAVSGSPGIVGEQQPPPGAGGGALGGSGGRYSLLIRKEKKALLDAVAEVSARIDEVPNGLLSLCITIQCPSEMLQRSDVLDVVSVFTKMARDRGSGSIQAVPVIGIKPESSGQLAWVVALEGLPPQAAEEAVRNGRLAAPQGTATMAAASQTTADGGGSQHIGTDTSSLQGQLQQLLQVSRMS